VRLIFHVIKIGRSTRAGKVTAIENGLRPNLTEVLLGQKKRKHCHMIHHQNTLVMFQVSLLTTGIHHLNAHHFEYFLGVNASHVTSALAKMATVYMPTSHAPSHQ
jgi:hypothetical protein